MEVIDRAKEKVMLYSGSLVQTSTGKIEKEHIYIGVTNDLSRREKEHNKITNSKATSPSIKQMHIEYGKEDYHVELKPLLSRKVSRALALDAEAYLIHRYSPTCNRQCSEARVDKFINSSFNKMYSNFKKASPRLTRDITE